MPSAATVYRTLNLIAITCAALGGSTAVRRRGLDPVGILSCACISGLSGGPATNDEFAFGSLARTP